MSTGSGSGNTGSGGKPSGRLDRLGPAAAWARSAAEPVRAAGGTASSVVRRALREPIALRDAERARLAAAATAALTSAGVADDASAALDAALDAWLADPGPATGALLTAAQGRYRADPARHTRSDLADLPLDEAQSLTRRLPRRGGQP